jgi:hypothetical protein
MANFFTPTDAGLVAHYADYDFETIKRWREKTYFASQVEDDNGFMLAYLELLDFLISTIQASLPKPPPVKVGDKLLSVKDVKANFDIVAVVGRYVQLRKSGGRFSGKCPLHDGKGFVSLVVYPNTQSWHCFGCNRSGDVIAWVQAADKVDFKQAISILGAL